MCGGPQWKREKVPDHKFDFIDTRDFTDHGCWMRTRYLWVYILVLKSFLVYVFDIFTAITMLTTDNWSNHIFNSCSQSGTNGCVTIPFSVGKWLFVGCIIFSFLLLAYEARKARKIIQSRDISYAFTNIMANNYYSLRSYDHFCFFCRINNSTKKKDDFAFFIFFTFKSWKRLLLADGPRQVINALTLYSFYLSQEDKGPFWDLNKYTDGSIVTGALIFSTLTTVVLFIGSALLLLAAGICYIPLLCYIQGNLKEYCCHKVDKRISELVKRKNKERLVQAARLAKKEAMGDFSHLKNKKGELIHNPLPQPTLPNVKLDDDEFDDASSRTRAPPSTYTAQSDYYYHSEYKGADYKSNYSNDYPPMPGYSQQHGYNGYPPSVHTTGTGTGEDPTLYYQDQYDSQTSLTAAAAPMARQNNGHGSSPLSNPHSATYGNYNQEIQGPVHSHDNYGESGNSGDLGQHNYTYDHYGTGYGVDIDQAGQGYEGRGYTAQIDNVPPRSQTAPQSQQGQFESSTYPYDSRVQAQEQVYHGTNTHYEDAYTRDYGRGGQAVG